MKINNYLTILRAWSIRRWITAAISAIATGLVISIPTAVLENSFFGRDIAVTAWSIPVIVITSILSGLLFASYVKNDSANVEDTSLKIGTAGAFFSFLAVGCPVCNKIALIALGYSGAMNYFAPVQPFLALAGIAILAYALIMRLNGEVRCQVKR
jgi:ABC-type sugar transport system permease subunit